MITIDLITGFLGSGKTTFLRKYVKYLLAQGENICILENDTARADYQKEDIWPAGRMPDVQTNQCKPYLEWHFPKMLKTRAIQILLLQYLRHQTLNRKTSSYVQ